MTYDDAVDVVAVLFSDMYPSDERAETLHVLRRMESAASSVVASPPAQRGPAVERLRAVLDGTR